MLTITGLIANLRLDRDTACGNGLAQTIEKRIETLIGIELRVRNEAAGVVERGLEKHLAFAAAGPLHPRTEEHVGLPDLIGELRFELLARGGGFAQQLLGGETVLAQETIQRGGGQCRLLLPLRGSELPQQ